MLELFNLKQEEKLQVEKEKSENKEITIFSYLTDIMSNKKGNVHERYDPSLSKFNTFMVLRFLSLDEGYLPYINVLNTFQDNLTKEEAYKLLVLTIPRTKKFLKFPKKETEDLYEEDINVISKYFICSKHEAEDFIKLKLLYKKDIDKIKEMYGGKR